MGVTSLIALLFLFILVKIKTIFSLVRCVAEMKAFVNGEPSVRQTPQETFDAFIAVLEVEIAKNIYRCERDEEYR